MLVALVLLGGVWPCEALVVSPARTEIMLAPGKSTKAILTATNDDKEEIQVDLSKKDWFVPTQNKAWSVKDWMELHGPSRFYLKPGESQKVEVTVTCPKQMTGEMVGMASFLYQTEHQGMVTPMISVSLYLTAAGTEKLSGQVEDMMVRKYNNQVSVGAKIRCTGNIHLRPSGRLVLTDSKGTEVGQVSVVEGQPTYPGTENIYGGMLPAGVTLPAGSYSARTDMKYRDVDLQLVQNFQVKPDGQIEMEALKAK